MNSGTQRARDLLTAYDLSLEQQILGRGSSLACRDQELWKRVEGLLRDRDPQEIHCLGLDPLTVMEESLKMAVTTAASRGRAKTRGGLQGLAKAFEVLEQAALNLYLGPWREEYKVVKTYSGLFTHHIKAVLPPPQIEQLFGLLGYRSSPSQQEQVLSVAPSSPDDFLRLSCAFFLARCECRLLEEALGKHRGEAQWELKMVRERQRGHGVQVAVENSQKTLKVNQLALEPFEEEPEMDLYTDEHVNGGAAGSQNRACAMKPPLGGDRTTASSSSSQVCVSTLTCQLTKMEVGRQLSREDPDTKTGSLQNDTTGFLSESAAALDDSLCSCLLSPPPYHCLTLCIQCQTQHADGCAVLDHCLAEKHHLVSQDFREPGGTCLQDHSLRGHAPVTSPTLSCNGAPCDSMLSCQLTTAKNVKRRQSDRESPDLESGRLQDGAVSEAVDSLCSCVQSPHLSLRRCVQCRTVHNDGCAMLKLCEENQHLLEGGSSMVSLQREGGGADGSRTSPALSSSSSQMSSLVLHDPQSSIPSFLCPITFHDCCNLGHLDPKVLCRSCNVFHSTSCRGQQMCLELDHSVQPLGVCVCGRTCSRNPLVLCRYCGSELCNECWYHSPVVCRVCHLTYDQSSPV